MTDLLHQAPTGSDFVVQALSRDLDRLVAIGTKGERLTARALAEGISRMQQGCAEAGTCGACPNGSKL